jgi:hypothetical protein
MNVRVRTNFSAALIAIAMTFPFWLAAGTDSLHKRVHLSSPATVGGKTIPEGDYDLIISGNQAKFTSNGKVVAEVPCTWKTLETKAAYDQVLIDGGAVTEIEFQGKTQAIDF